MTFSGKALLQISNQSFVHKYSFTLLAFYGDVKRDQWYIPDDSVSGGDLTQVQQFFDRCAAKAKTLQ